jgi:hypothetical protein
MALSTGTVTIADDGSHTGSGFALVLYERFIDGLQLPETEFETQVQLDAKRASAAQCVKMAGAIIDYFKNNAELSGNATVSTQSVGRTPDPNIANTAIQAPSSPVTIPISGGIL